ncbi:hypothetical protein QTP88_028694 [Uroleucon formosanum]
MNINIFINLYKCNNLALPRNTTRKRHYRHLQKIIFDLLEINKLCMMRHRLHIFSPRKSVSINERSTKDFKNNKQNTRVDGECKKKKKHLRRLSSKRRVDKFKNHDQAINHVVPNRNNVLHRHYLIDLFLGVFYPHSSSVILANRIVLGCLVLWIYCQSSLSQIVKKTPTKQIVNVGPGGIYSDRVRLLCTVPSPNFGGGSSSKPGHAASADDVSAAASSHHHHGGSSSATSATEHLLHKDIAAVAQGGWNVTKSLMNVKAEEDNVSTNRLKITVNNDNVLSRTIRLTHSSQPLYPLRNVTISSSLSHSLALPLPSTLDGSRKREAGPMWRLKAVAVTGLIFTARSWPLTMVIKGCTPGIIQNMLLYRRFHSMI